MRIAENWDGSPGTADEERLAGVASYLDVLERLHRSLRPKLYLEIGVRHGASLRRARGPAIGIDPDPDIAHDLPSTTRVISQTSDDYFADPSNVASPDLCFIDGLHWFECALRDFMNLERHAAPGCVAIFDDIYPNHPAQAERRRRTRAWTGDVWRILPALRRHRPDLFLACLDTSPTGSLLVAGLDPANLVLWDNYDAISKDDEGAPPPEDVLERVGAIDPSGPEFARILTGLEEARGRALTPRQTVDRLRTIETGGSPVPGVRPANRPQLSVVVVGYNMARELPRTIRSLSPAMQRGIDPADYEIILVDNGSTRPFDEDALRRLQPGLVVARVEKATISPVPAINLGLGLARGDLVGVCIDGARMASPGLLAGVLAASRLHPRPMVGTIAFHLGHEVQMKSIRHGYDQGVEDALLADSGWEEDGYRLFEIATFAGSSAGGWFDLPAESNAVFLRKDHWTALGGWDEGFVSPGGGLANLDMWSRICADPEGELIMLLGEATFHQVHGGIATNTIAPPTALFNEEYARLRGRAYARPTRRPLFVGRLPNAMQASLQRSIEQMSR